MLAIHHTASYTATNSNLHIKSDLKWCIDTLCHNLNTLEDLDYIHAKHQYITKLMVSALRNRTHPTSFEWLKGHMGIQGSEEADSLAAQGTQEALDPGPPVNPPPPHVPSSVACLSSLTQSMATKLICRMRVAKMTKHRDRVAGSITHIQSTLESIENNIPAQDRIWKSLNSNQRDTSPEIRNFLWKLTHNCLKIGNYWLRIPKYEHHSECEHCQQMETIDHILFECPQNHGKRLWTIA
ncbi:uncharacterized protein EI90DRAFT_2856666, partial [Cantharellus anzutake]|uniref:uncharacterized protein n=1 Tax=Cantharellus anzutake TaxID=1750568 RepID=UPI001906CD09